MLIGFENDLRNSTILCVAFLLRRMKAIFTDFAFFFLKKNDNKKKCHDEIMQKGNAGDNFLLLATTQGQQRQTLQRRSLGVV